MTLFRLRNVGGFSCNTLFTSSMSAVYCVIDMSVVSCVSYSLDKTALLLLRYVRYQGLYYSILDIMDMSQPLFLEMYLVDRMTTTS